MMEEINRILLLSRYSKHSKQLIHYGIAMAKNLGADLYVLHIDDDPFNLKGWNMGIPLRNLKKEYKNMQQDIKSTLDKMIKSELDKANPIEVKYIIIEGDAVREVINLVDKEKIDLFVMLAHEEGHLEHLLFDRDNHKIIRRLPCSIFLLKTTWA